jgi:uncharacterized protein YndB with AHSA1/START domain
MAREFEIRRDAELAGTPEDVWHAVATNEGNAAWLFPGLVDRDQATVWEPPHRLVLRMEGENGWFNQIEDVIEARNGSTTVLRYVHSGILDEDWDNQYDSAGRHTDFYLHTLGQYLEHFNGRTATYIGGAGSSGLEGPEASSSPGSFGVLKRALGVGDDASVGDRVKFGPDSIEGEVDYVNPHFLGIRTADGLYRFFGREAWGMATGMSAHLFTDGVDKERTERAWQEWLGSLYDAG